MCVPHEANKYEVGVQTAMLIIIDPDCLCFSYRYRDYSHWFKLLVSYCSVCLKYLYRVLCGNEKVPIKSDPNYAGVKHVRLL